MARPAAASCFSTIVLRSAKNSASVAGCESQADRHRLTSSSTNNALCTRTIKVPDFRTESAVASRPGLNPPNQALNMTAQRNSDTGAAVKWISGHRELISAAVTDTTAAPYFAIIGGADHHRRSGFVIVFQI